MRHFEKGESYWWCQQANIRTIWGKLRHFGNPTSRAFLDLAYLSTFSFFPPPRSPWSNNIGLLSVPQTPNSFTLQSIIMFCSFCLGHSCPYWPTPTHPAGLGFDLQNKLSWLPNITQMPTTLSHWGLYFSFRVVSQLIFCIYFCGSLFNVHLPL